MITPAQEPFSMKSPNFLKKAVRKKKKKRRPGSPFRDYRKIADTERVQATERLFGSQGPASPVRKIDPKTGRVVAIIDAH